MENIKLKKDLIEQLIEISKEAGEAILKVYNTNFDFQIKEDLSPLTKADTLSNNIICEKLKILTPDTPILSEENSDIPFRIRSTWNQYWLIDPLDGTKEFIKRNGEFTVNIALIRNKRPILGVIFVPVTNEVFYGYEDEGSFYIKEDGEAKKIEVVNNDSEPLRIVSSRSHPNKKLESSLDKIGNYELITIGSSLKFCLIAKGEADCYLRFGHTSEWDTAAGEIIAKSAGASVVNLENKLLKYNSSKGYKNPYFIVSNSKANKEKILSIL